MTYKDAKRDGREHVIRDGLVYSGPDGGSFKEVLASFDEYFTFVTRAETSWTGRRFEFERLERVAVFLNVVAPKKHSRQDRDMVVVSNALCPLSAAE